MILSYKKTKTIICKVLKLRGGSQSSDLLLLSPIEIKVQLPFKAFVRFIPCGNVTFPRTPHFTTVSITLVKSSQTTYFAPLKPTYLPTEKKANQNKTFCHSPTILSNLHLRRPSEFRPNAQNTLTLNAAMQPASPTSTSAQTSHRND